MGRTIFLTHLITGPGALYLPGIMMTSVSSGGASIIPSPSSLSILIRIYSIWNYWFVIIKMWKVINSAYRFIHSIVFGLFPDSLHSSMICRMMICACSMFHAGRDSAMLSTTAFPVRSKSSYNSRVFYTMSLNKITQVKNLKDTKIRNLRFSKSSEKLEKFKKKIFSRKFFKIFL